MVRRKTQRDKVADPEKETARRERNRLYARGYRARLKDAKQKQKLLASNTPQPRVPRDDSLEDRHILGEGPPSIHEQLLQSDSSNPYYPVPGYTPQRERENIQQRPLSVADS